LAGIVRHRPLSPIDVRDAREIERDVAAFEGESNGRLIVTANARAVAHRELIIMLAAGRRLPTVYPFRIFVTDCGLIRCGPDTTDHPFRRAAGYVDRILKREKAANLPAPSRNWRSISRQSAVVAARTSRRR
jgi:hypothetical protein